MGTPAEEKIFDLAAAMPKMSAGAIVDAASKAAELFFDDFPIDAPAAATFIGYATTALAHAYFRRKFDRAPDQADVDSGLFGHAMAAAARELADPFERLSMEIADRPPTLH
jgi:hypothetical protein